MYTIMGATGNIGSKLTALLLERGEEVKIISRSKENVVNLCGKGAEAAIGDAQDTEFLTHAFNGADAVFTMIPPNYMADDLREYYNEISKSITAAIENSDVKYVVNLSSVGADLPEGTGAINGLYDHEMRINQVKGINILHIRPAYFMENLLMSLDQIKNNGQLFSALNPALKIPMIATVDIAKIAEQELVNRDFEGIQVRELYGERDVSMNEITALLKKKLDRDKLEYHRISYEDEKQGMIDMGMSPVAAGQMSQMTRALNDGILGGKERTPHNTTGTSIESFIEYISNTYFQR